MDEAVVVGMEEENSEICPRNRSVVGMEEVKWRICPRNKSGRGHGESSPDLCVNSSFSHIELFMLLLSSIMHFEWC